MIEIRSQLKAQFSFNFIFHLKYFLLHRYLVWFEAFLTNMELYHPSSMNLLKKVAIAVAHSLIPGSLCAEDKMMDTFMKFAKSSGRFYFFFTISIIMVNE